MKRKILLLIAMAILAAPLLGARDKGVIVWDESLYPGTGRFADNWFVSAGGGVNTVFNPASWGVLSPAAEISFGKWASPSLGFRIGAHGLRNAPNGTETGWFSGYHKFGFYHADADILWNINSTFAGWNPGRFYNVSPFLRFGVLGVRQKGEKPAFEFEGGAGILNTFRLAKRLDLYVELSAIACREKFVRERGTVAVFPSLTAGLSVKVGRIGFRRIERVRETEIVEIEKIDTVTVERIDTLTVVDERILKEMRETPLTIYFDLDKTFLTDREKAHLERYAHFVLTPETKVTLVGSADKETGNSDHNQWLSEERCKTVREELISVYGLKRENIEEIANGDRKNEFNTPEKNRCVTLYIQPEEYEIKIDNINLEAL